MEFTVSAGAQKKSADRNGTNPNNRRKSILTDHRLPVD